MPRNKAFVLFINTISWCSIIRGFGFVTFENVESVEKVLNFSRDNPGEHHVIDHKQVRYNSEASLEALGLRYKAQVVVLL